eukprot:scaffold213003_cov31-Tisochrysis_lutea.AAC.4
MLAPAQLIIDGGEQHHPQVEYCSLLLVCEVLSYESHEACSILISHTSCNGIVVVEKRMCCIDGEGESRVCPYDRRIAWCKRPGLDPRPNFENKLFLVLMEQLTRRSFAVELTA